MGSTPLHVSAAWGAHVCTQKHNSSIAPSPCGRQGSPHTRSPTLHSLCTESLLPPALSIPQPSHTRAHLLLASPVCLPKVFAARGTCFDTISSTKEAAHLA